MSWWNLISRSFVYPSMMPCTNLRKKIAAALHGRHKSSPRAEKCFWRDRGQQLKRKITVSDRVERDDWPGQLGERF